MAEVRRTACNRDCADACSVLATVDNGEVVRLAGDPDHPITRGFLCQRTNRFLRRQNAPERLRTPLLRRGSELEEASWDEALDHVATSLLRIREESGPAAILHYRSGGSLGLVKHVIDAFWERFGPTTIKRGDICSGAGDHAQLTDFGVEDSSDVFDLLHARHVVLWGKNPHVAAVHLVPVLHEARERGARLHLVDPVHHRGAELCETFVQPRPGGDVALGLGVARSLFERGLADVDAPSYCNGLDDFRQLADGRTLADWAELADVSTTEIEALADVLADGPTTLVLGWGMQRRANGSTCIRVLDAIAAVSGNVGVRGGGASFYFARRAAFDLSFVRGAAAAPRTLPEALLGRAILQADEPPIRAAWITAGNPVAMLPDSRTVQRALRSLELTVVVDSFLTDTARCADVVLPTTTFLEDDDLVGAYGHHWVAEVRPVVAAPEGVKSDHEILLDLAPRLGVEDFTDDVETWKRRLLPERHGGIDLDAVRAAGGHAKRPDAPDVLFADRRFPTPSGKVELVTDAEPEPPAVRPDRPRLLMALATEKAQASQWRAEQQDGPATAIVHPEAARGLPEGNLARLESDLGAMDVVLRFDERQRRDVVLLEKGGWLSAGRCANALVEARESDAGGCAAYHDTPVSLVHPMW